MTVCEEPVFFEVGMQLRSCQEQGSLAAPSRPQPGAVTWPEMVLT